MSVKPDTIVFLAQGKLTAPQQSRKVKPDGVPIRVTAGCC